MTPTNIGQYIVYEPVVAGMPLGGIHLNAKIIGGPTTLDYTSWQTPHPRELLWTCADEAGHTFVIKHSQIVDSSNLSHNGFGVKIALCPQCEEEEFFLEDDYVCGYCRTNVVDP